MISAGFDGSWFVAEPAADVPAQHLIGLLRPSRQASFARKSRPRRCCCSTPLCSDAALLAPFPQLAMVIFLEHTDASAVVSVRASLVEAAANDALGSSMLYRVGHGDFIVVLS